MVFFNFPGGFRVAGGEPVDGDRYLQPDITSRDALVSGGRAHDGLLVYVQADKTIYQYDEAGLVWVPIGSGSGAGGVLSFNYLADTTAIVAPPGSGAIRWDNATQLSAGKLFISHTDNDGTIISNILEDLVDVGEEIVLFDGGNTNNFQRWQIDAITPQTGYTEYDITLIDGAHSFSDTDPINLTLLVNGLSGCKPAFTNKDETPTVTTGDESTTGVTLAVAPRGFIGVYINGVLANLGDNVKTKDCYFSNDGGTTARAFVDVAAGDELIWNGVISGFELATSDRVDLLYNN